MKWPAVVNAAMNQSAGNFLTSRETIFFSGSTLLRGIMYLATNQYVTILRNVASQIANYTVSPRR